jgi:glucose-6-phosphate dehydrogenase assembly protein OpcA
VAVTLWDTTGSTIVEALLAERRAMGALASGIAVTVVIVVDERHVAEAKAAAAVAAAAHPCRLLVVIRRDPTADTRLDAEVQVGGGLGPTEAVVMRMYGQLTLHAQSVVLPLLAPDAPVVTWWHGPPPDLIGTDPLGVLANRRITDSARAADPLAALRRRAEDFTVGDTDLAWTRTTPWRSLLASALDPCAVDGPARAVIDAEPGNASAALLAGWLRSRMAAATTLQASSGPGITGVELTVGAGLRVAITRRDGRMATLRRGEERERRLPLPRRALGDLLAEELQRLDPDDIYADALAAATGIRRPRRTVDGAGPRQPRAGLGWRHTRADMRSGAASASIVVHRDAAMLAHAGAARLLTALLDAQAARGQASLVVTGGGIVTATLHALSASSARDALDWRELDVWWADERFLAAGDLERNETRARQALLDSVALDPHRVHPMPASDGEFGDDVDAAAASYADALATAARPDDDLPVPPFDVALLGVGADGHVASLFAGLSALDDERMVIAVRDAPTPPPIRMSMTFAAINSARQIWLLAAGAHKAGATGMAVVGGQRSRIPAARVRGQEQTVWLLDRDAAGRLPPSQAGTDAP